MRRADRLFQLVQILRRGRVVTARELAARLEVAERTVYRDVADLCASGVPIEAAAGVGYRLRHFELPPLMFTREEVEALVLGGRIVASWADRELAAAGRTALAKLEGALPGDRHDLVQSTLLFAPEGWRAVPRPDRELILVRRALRESHKLRLAYRDANGQATERVVRPLALAFYGPVWTLAAWCELREDFRNFRVDRIAALEMTPDTFAAEPGRTLEEYVRRLEAEPPAPHM
ncbi:MAG: YafY family transcriptional regulator [Holophagales bacterium]|nr:MAG: YafY family transcriptional regulator [Holophagales bacterium]